MSLDIVADRIALLTAAAVPRRRKIAWRYTLVLIGVHLAAAFAFVPWFFSWTGVILAVIGLHLFGIIGITVCYHRLLTHRAFACPKWVEHTLAIIGLLGMQDAPARWVAVHRLHHQHADAARDPHSPVESFWWSHIGWMLVEHPELTRYGIYERYAKDVLRDRFYVFMERQIGWIMLASWLAFYLGGFLFVLGRGGTLLQAVQFGASLLVWGVFVRVVASWHVAWSINSVTHCFGYRNYETDEDSRNNLVVGLLSGGEGWHNNHHADPRAARFGHRWFELDAGYRVIRLLEMCGLAWNVIAPHGRTTPVNDSSGRRTTRGGQDMPPEAIAIAKN
jgi:stearoyl-CoA desaturase (delta-9 desaturase)